MLGHAAVKTAWTGLYVHDGRDTEMRFDSFILDVGSVKGGGEDEVGKFELAGSRDSYGNIRFTKQYIGEHAIGYVGQLSDLANGNQLITGQWYFLELGPLESDPERDEDHYFELFRDLETERKREAAFKMVVARMKAAVGVIRLVFEDLVSGAIQVLFLAESQTTSQQFWFTAVSVASGLLMSLGGPIFDAVSAWRHSGTAGEAWRSSVGSCFWVCLRCKLKV